MALIAKLLLLLVATLSTPLVAALPSRHRDPAAPHFVSAHTDHDELVQRFQQGLPAPEGYRLPWPGGLSRQLTQGENTFYTHNGIGAFAFDFGLTYEPVAAARAGVVSMVKADDTSGGCVASFAGRGNYVVVDHRDGTSALYLHLDYLGTLVKVGDVVTQGEIIGISGATGLTCDDGGKGPGPHLHFQVERTEPGVYFTQTIPIAFEDVPGDGVPGELGYYRSGNYPGVPMPPGALLMLRAGRPYAVAYYPPEAPAEPLLSSEFAAAAPAGDGSAPPSGDAQAAPGAVIVTTDVTLDATVAPTQPPTSTPPPTSTAVFTPTTPPPTSSPLPTDTPVPPPTDTPTPAPTPSAIPQSLPTDTPTVVPPPADTATPTATGVGP